jgi:hypothetical protein
MALETRRRTHEETNERNQPLHIVSERNSRLSGPRTDRLFWMSHLMRTRRFDLSMEDCFGFYSKGMESRCDSDKVPASAQEIARRKKHRAENIARKGDTSKTPQRQRSTRPFYH